MYGQSPYQASEFQRVRPKHDPNFKGWNVHVHREFPRKLESTHLSRDNLSREIGRTANLQTESCGSWRFDSTNLEFLELGSRRKS